MINKIKNIVYGILIHTQKYTKLDHIYLAKGGFWVSGFNVISILLGIVTTVIFARFSDKMTYGMYQYVIALANTLAILSLPGINTAILRSVAKGYDGSLAYGVKAKFKFSLLGSLASLLVGGFFYFFKHDDLLAQLMLVVAVFYPTNFSFNCLFSFYNAKKKFLKMTALQLISRISSVVGLVFAILFLKSIFGIIFTYFLIISVFNIFLYLYIQKLEGINDDFEKDVVSYGKKLTVINIIPQLLNNFDTIVIPIFLGLESLALYAIAIKIPDTIKGFLNSFETVITPKLVNADRRIFISKFKNFWVISSLVLITMLMIVLLPLANKILFGNSYGDAVFLGQVYCLAIIPFFIRRLLNDWMTANQESRMFFKNTTFWSVSNAILILIALIILKSLIVVIVARVIMSIISLIYGFTLLLKRKK